MLINIIYSWERYRSAAKNSLFKTEWSSKSSISWRNKVVILKGFRSVPHFRIDFNRINLLIPSAATSRQISFSWFSTRMKRYLEKWSWLFFFSLYLAVLLLWRIRAMWGPILPSFATSSTLKGLASLGSWKNANQFESRPWTTIAHVIFAWVFWT